MRAAGRPARIKIVPLSGVVAMGSFSLMHWIVVLAIILILFGAGKLPRCVGDFAKGIKAFKAGMKVVEEGADATAERARSRGRRGEPRAAPRRRGPRGGRRV